MNDELFERMASAIIEIDGECPSEKALDAALATLEPGDFIRDGVLVESMETIRCMETRARDEGAEEMRERVAQTAFTVWKDGTWIAWSETDAHYAENEEHWLCTIPVAREFRGLTP